MTSRHPSSPPLHAEVPARSQLLRHDGRWWPAYRTDSVPTSVVAFTNEPDRFTAAMATADQAVTSPGTGQNKSPAPGSKGRR